MDKVKMIIFPVGFGLMLVLCSWFFSYPLSIDSPHDFIFNHISPLFWIGLPSSLVSLYVVTALTRNKHLRLGACLLIVFLMYSLNYFYYSLPSSDALTVRGLTEYAIEKDDLDPSKPSHWYYQWPSFFILGKVAISMTTLDLRSFEFILFAVLGVVYFLSLYSYIARFSEDYSYTAVIAYFIVMQWYLNYQFAPFSLAMGLLFPLIMLESHTFRSREITLSAVVLFIGVTFIHPFAAVFYILYIASTAVIRRSSRYLQLFCFTLTTYLLVSIFFTKLFFSSVIERLSGLYLYEYQMIIAMTSSERVASPPPIDSIAQIFSRVTWVSTTMIVSIGFLLLLIKRSLRTVDLSLLVSMVAYTALAAILPIMGRRAFFALLIPISLGVTYYYKSKFGRHLKYSFLIIVLLLTSIPLTRSFYDSQIFFQTEVEYQSANFLINHYNWTKQSSILSHFRVMRYLETKTASDSEFGHDLTSTFPEDARNYDCAFYTIGLGKNLLLHNQSAPEAFSGVGYNRVFDSTFCAILIKMNSS